MRSYSAHESLESLVGDPVEIITAEVRKFIVRDFHDGPTSVFILSNFRPLIELVFEASQIYRCNIRMIFIGRQPLLRLPVLTAVPVPEAINLTKNLHAIMEGL